MTWLAWLRQSPAKPNSRHMLEHIERLKSWQALDLPAGIERQVHQNRLLKIAREGGQMTPADLAKFEVQRRYATLVALAIEGMATVTDEIIDLHDRIIGKLFNAAKNKHQQQFQASGKAINDKVRMYGRIGQALIEAKQSGSDPFAAIEAVMPWDTFAASVTEAQTLARPADFDFLHHIGESYATLRRYAPQFLGVINKGYNPDREMWQKTEGKAYFTGDPSRAALKVSFFGPFYGGYNVIALDREYRHALVCGPDRDYLWILSRTPTISDEMKQQMLAIATREGFEVNKLIWVKQPGA